MSLSYNPQPVIMERGEGAYLFDREGRRYLDFLAGIAVNTLGYSHPRLTKELQEQVGNLLHVSNAFWTEPQIRLQHLLCQETFADRVFFCNSGAEANEAAIKLARRYQRVVRETGRYEIITFFKSFHGRTFAALSATGQPKYHAGFEPMVPGFHYADFGDLERVKQLVGEHTAAIMVEPVQGEGGVRPAPEGFLSDLRDLCDEEGILLIFDEVQCGMGRTGSLLAGQHHFGVTPDIVSLAKGIGGGVPLGAMMATGEVAQGFERGSHATTYGGNPLATRAGLVVLETLLGEGFLDNVGRVGAYFREQAAARLGAHSRVKEVRGAGLMNGVELDADAATAGKVVAAARARGVLLNTAGGTTMRFVPPLIVSESHVDEALDAVAGALTEVF